MEGVRTRTSELLEPLRLLGLSDRRLDLAIGLALLILVGLSRVAVFPASIWEQDEAYFAAAVVGIDVADSKPHPPFFPLWIGLGKLVHRTGVPPAESLMLISAVLSTWLLIPLAALWSRFLRRDLALAAAFMALMVPGMWLYSGRAFSGIGATAFFVLALGLWTRPGSRSLTGGSVAAGLAVLIRPHYALAVVVVMAVLLSRRPRRRWATIVAPAAIFVAVGSTVFVVAAGGLAEVLYVLSLHATQHFDALPMASRGLLDSGITRVLVSPVVTVIWLALTVLGAFTTLGTKKECESGWLVLGALVAMIVVVFGFSNPAHPRYAVPLVVLSSGFVVVGLRRFLSTRWTLVTAVISVCIAAAVTLPAARVYRQELSPPLRALDRAFSLAADRGGVVVADHTLHAFVGYREALGPLEAPVVFDHVLELGATPPPAARAVMIFDGNNGGSLVESERVEVFSCEQALLRRVSQHRFLEITVADGATIDDRSRMIGRSMPHLTRPLLRRPTPPTDSVNNYELTIKN